MIKGKKTIKIGDIFRYGRPYDPGPEIIDGVKNYFHMSYSEGCRLPLLDSGINPIEEIVGPEGLRRPAILISSSPHKIGSHVTPWQDFFDPDNGHIHYFGDNKIPGNDPSLSPGNKVLLEAYRAHNSFELDLRGRSAPILFFRRVKYNGKVKGYVKFQGIGIIKNVELVTQYNRKQECSFSNYAYDFLVLSLFHENEEFNWQWINSRRDKKIELNETLKLAPKSWQMWVRDGYRVVERCRRRVSKLLTKTSNEQRPIAGTKEARVLEEIYTFYKNNKSSYEALAAVVSARILSSSGGRYFEGWITPPSSDGGSDFVGRLDIGSDFSKVKLIVLGQAKCEQTDTPTGGRDVARTVARLKRGWIGAYVTTSYFSEAVQREIIEDEYPILLVHGLRLATEVLSIIHEQGFKDLLTFLKDVDQNYKNKIQIRRPEEILFE